MSARNPSATSVLSIFKKCPEMFVGILVATTLCLPNSLFLLFYGPTNPGFFQDWDEPLYALILRSVGRYSLNELLITFPLPPSDFPYLPRFYAHSLVDFILGKTLVWSNFGVAAFLLILDWACILGAFVSFTSLFRRMSPRLEVRATAALFSVAFPMIPALAEGWLVFPTSWIVSGAPMGVFPSLPAMRGIYTQISIAPSLLILTRTLEYLTGVTTTRNNLGNGLLLGTFIGVLVYIYPFAFLALVGLVVCFSVFWTIASPSSAYLLLARLSGIGIGCGFVSLPGVVITANMRPAMGMLRGVGGPFPAWVPIDYLVIVGSGFLLLRAVSAQTRLWEITAASVLCSELMLGNLEALTQTVSTPYHFSLFFYRPILTGLLAIPLVEKVASRTRKLSHLLFGILLISACCIQLKLAYSSFKYSEEDSRLFEATAAAVPKDQVIGSSPFTDMAAGLPLSSLEPFWLESLTDTKTHFGESDFRALFAANPMGYGILRYILLHQGRTLNFCSSFGVQRPQGLDAPPIFRWFTEMLFDECKTVKGQITRLCQLSDWKWLPQFFIVSGGELTMRRENKGNQEVIYSGEPTHTKYLIKIDRQTERQVICGRSRE